MTSVTKVMCAAMSKMWLSKFQFWCVQNAGFSVLCGMCFLADPTVSRIFHFPQMRLERSDLNFPLFLPLRQGGTVPVSPRRCIQRILSHLQKGGGGASNKGFLFTKTTLSCTGWANRENGCSHLLTRNGRWEDGINLAPVSYLVESPT